MSGPPPKDPRLRQRTNKHSTTAKLATASDGTAVVAVLTMPPLPDRPCPNEEPDCAACKGTGILPWHDQTVAMWRDVWRSPMAHEYVQADNHRLVAYAVLVDRFWWGDTDVAAEIRLQGQCFGLTPLDRRRLQWEIQRVENAPRRQTVPLKRRASDPLGYLRRVK